MAEVVASRCVIVSHLRVSFTSLRRRRFLSSFILPLAIRLRVERKLLLPVYDFVIVQAAAAAIHNGSFPCFFFFVALLLCPSRNFQLISFLARGINVNQFESVKRGRGEQQVCHLRHFRRFTFTKNYRRFLPFLASLSWFFYRSARTVNWLSLKKTKELSN